MARRIRIPGLVDLLRVSDAEEIRALNAEPCIDRNFIARGPLINRLIVARIRRWFRISGQFLPSLARRDDAARSDSHRVGEVARPCTPRAVDRRADRTPGGFRWQQS